MSDIKAVIQLLCQHLNSLLNVNLKPDNFRLSKFNNNDKDTIQALWTTLEKMCLSLGPKIPHFEKCTSQVWVKLQLACMGYNCCEFYSLPTDCSSGSRELLLALMWVIAKENALAVLTQERVRQSPLSQEYSDISKEQVTNSSTKTVPLLKTETKHSLSSEHQINYCLWLANRLRYNINQIQDLEEERIKHTHKVHQATAGSSGLPHLSVFETKLVKDPDLLNQWMPKLSKLNDLINAHTKWLKKKSVFWEWMETVIEMKEKDTCADDSLQFYNKTALTEFVNAIHVYSERAKKYQGPEGGSGPPPHPRFLISSLYAKSVSNLVRKASSSDLLADMGLSENGVVMHASDWLALVDSELQEVEKMKHEKVQELNLRLQSLTQKLALVAISDVSNGEVESEDCSK